MRRFGPARVLLTLLVAWPGFAFGQTEDATRAAARQLATEGVGNLQDGQFAVAAEKLNRAFQALAVPTLGLWSARALVGSGKLVEAAERYLEVTRLDPKAGDEAVQRQAQVDALQEYDALQPRIPRVTLALSNAQVDDTLRVAIDGVAVPPTLVRAQIPLDPGAHSIDATQGARHATQALSIAEGARVSVTLHFVGTSTAGAPSRSSVPSGSTSSARGATPSPLSDIDAGRRFAPVRPLPLGFWLSLGAGGVGLVSGGGTAWLASRELDRLSPHCPGGVCDPQYRGDVQRLNAYRYASTASFAVGGAGLITAAVVWFTGRSKNSDARPYVRPRVGLREVGVEGAF